MEEEKFRLTTCHCKDLNCLGSEVYAEECSCNTQTELEDIKLKIKELEIQNKYEKLKSIL